MRSAWLVLLSFGVIPILSGCSFFQDQDEENLPAKLVAYKDNLDLKQLWKTKVGKGSELLHLSLFPSGNDDKVFMASHNGNVAAYDPLTGKVFWKVNLEIDLTSGPAYGEERVIVYGKDGELICLRAEDGSEVWRTHIKGESVAVPLVADNNVVIHTIDGQIRSFSIFDGSERWAVTQDMPALTLRGSSTPIVLGNNVIAGFDNGRMMSIDIEAGMVIWESMLSPASGRSDLDRLSDIDGVIKNVGQDIYAVGYQSQLASIAAESGQLIWSKELSSEAGVEIDDNYIYAVTDEGDLVGMSRKDGTEIWRKKVLLRREVTAPTKYKSTIVVGDFEGYVHFFDHETGELVSRRRVGKGAISGSPVVIGDYLYVQNESSEVTVFFIPVTEDIDSFQSNNLGGP